jgi:integral membrane protein (TIGR01906 family)
LRAPMRPTAESAISVLVALTTCLSTIGLGACLLLNPIWVGFEQSRSGVTDVTGYSDEQVQHVTGSILSDLVFGPPDFDVSVDGAPVLTERERAHMADVRGTFALAGLIVLAAFAVLVGLGLVRRKRRSYWLAVRAGAVLTIGVVAVVGAFCLLFFDQAFELMHRVFFQAGSYTFDPRTDRLVQLFPDQFWFESAMALGVAVVALSGGIILVSGRLAAGRPDERSGEGARP